MFETSVVRTQVRAMERRYGLLSVSVVAHVLVIVAVISATVTNTSFPRQAPNQISYPLLPAPPPALGTPNASPHPAPRPATPPPQRTPARTAVVAPPVIPPTIEPVSPGSASTTADATTTAGGSEPGVPGRPDGRPDGIGVDGSPASQSTGTQIDPLPVGGDVKAPEVIHRVQPLYPRPAINARLNGFVIVECIIDRSGRIRDARVLKSSSGVFEQAALDAVQRWVFKPGSLHGAPVDTIFNLTVTFTISE